MPVFIARNAEFASRTKAEGPPRSAPGKHPLFGFAGRLTHHRPGQNNRSAGFPRRAARRAAAVARPQPGQPEPPTINEKTHRRLHARGRADRNRSRTARPGAHHSDDVLGVRHLRPCITCEQIEQFMIVALISADRSIGRIKILVVGLVKDADF